MGIKKELKIVLDELEILFEGIDIFKIILQKINTSNTERASINYTEFESGEIETFTYMIYNISGYDNGYMFQYIYNSEVINAFSVLFGKKQGSITTENKITFYGSFIHEKGRDFIYNLIEDYFKTENFIGLRRFDIACDVPENKKRIIESFKREPKTALNYNIKKGEHETYYFGNRANRTRLIRIYDKVLDTFNKGKGHLYNFTETDDVTRVEVEFLKNSIDAINDKEEYVTYTKLLKDDKILKDLFMQSVYKTIGFFEEVDFDEYEFSFPRRHIKDLKGYYLKFNQLPEWYQKNGFGLFKKIKEAIGFEGFFGYLFEITENKKGLEDFLKYYYKKKWGEKKVRAKNMNQAKFLKSFYDKDQLSDDLFETIYKKPKMDQDYICYELNKTIKKINSKI